MTTHIYDADRRERATACDCLETRPRINKASGSADFDSWLFERLAVRTGEDVLDVGCGTGGQSLHFARQIRPQLDDALMFYRATTYWDAAVEPMVQEEMARQIADGGAFGYAKNGYLIVGRVPA